MVMWKGKRQSYGTAQHYMNGRRLTMSRYLNHFYPIYDWGIIGYFFNKNPIQSKIILDDYSKANDTKQEEVLNILMEGKSKIIYIVGARGWGKTCTCAWFCDGMYKLNPKIKIYFVGEGVKKIFPEWVSYADKIQDVPNGSFIVVDEASIRYSAREFYKEANIVLGKLMAIARHKELSVLFITQHVGLIDINITRLRDIIIWKKSNDYGLSERRSEGGRANKQKKFFDKIRMNMAPRKIDEVLFEYPAEKRFIHFTHNMPDWWNEEISKSFEKFSFAEKIEKPTKLKRGFGKTAVDVTENM
jgi:hypothetical protein